MLLLMPSWVAAQDEPPGFAAVIERIATREKANMLVLRRYAPVAETYIQKLKPDPDLGSVPTGDEYFLGRLDFSEGYPTDRSFMKKKGFGGRLAQKLTGMYKLHFLPLGFMQMMILDADGLDSTNYNFKFVRREFVGDVRTLVIDVAPKEPKDRGRFIGRIWVEDQEYNIVRFNGSYSKAPRGKVYLHFDSWRLNLQPNLWLPAYVYTEESDLEYAMFRSVTFKAQTRLWGYDLKAAGRREEFTSITVESENVADGSEAGRDLTPVESTRAWERMAEDNVVDRLEVAGLVAPQGEVDKVLQTVVSNLEITNELNLDPQVRARVLLTAPLESFTVGRTIVVSRGLVDVLPDEATLAAVLAHELAHVVLGHRLDTKYAFSDRMIFPDEEAFMHMGFSHDGRQEAEADAKALEMLKKSPYGTDEKLQQVGLFLKQLNVRKQALPNLLKAHVGDSMLSGNDLRLAQLAPTGPELQTRSTEQIAALPLGARVKLDPWSNRIELVKTPIVPLVSPKEKMPFEVTPVFPYVTRSISGTANSTDAAATATR
ncbi:MAG: M48 family metalloprotease [Candidatus Korobacteraceae bacterium]